MGFSAKGTSGRAEGCTPRAGASILTHIFPASGAGSVSDTPVILSAVRTPIGKYLGGLSSFTAPALGALVIREAVRRAGVDPTSVDEVIMGQVVQGGSGQAPARQAMIHAGIPGHVPALTINKVCGSGRPSPASPSRSQPWRLGHIPPPPSSRRSSRSSSSSTPPRSSRRRSRPTAAGSRTSSRITASSTCSCGRRRAGPSGG